MAVVGRVYGRKISRPYQGEERLFDSLRTGLRDSRLRGNDGLRAGMTGWARGVTGWRPVRGEALEPNERAGLGRPEASAPLAQLDAHVVGAANERYLQPGPNLARLCGELGPALS